MSSVAGRTTRPGSSVYNVTTWGIITFTDALRQEVVRDKTGIRTTIIEPGYVDTELQSHLKPEAQKALAVRYHDSKVLEPEDIAHAILYVISQLKHVAVSELLIRPTESI